MFWDTGTSQMLVVHEIAPTRKECPNILFKKGEEYAYFTIYFSRVGEYHCPAAGMLKKEQKVEKLTGAL